MQVCGGGGGHGNNEKSEGEKGGEELVMYLMNGSSVPIHEIQVAFSNPFCWSPGLLQCSEAMLLTLNIPINKHFLVFIIEAAQKLGEVQ